MSWRETLAKWIAGPGSRDSGAAFHEAAGKTVTERDDDSGWTRLTGDTTRDLSPLTQDRMRRLSCWLWQFNPLARQLIELPICYLLAGGVRLTVKNEAAQQALDRFWRDPISAMDRRLPMLARSWKLGGELCLPVFSDLTGRVRLGYLDPARIATVICDPDNESQPIGVITRRDARGNSLRYRVVVRGPEEVFGDRARAIRETLADGECIFAARNVLLPGPRGRSDLLPLIDWLDAYERYLYGEIDRAETLHSFVWDVTLRGATQEQVDERARAIVRPDPGDVRVHNESEEWQAVSPKLEAADSEAASRLWKNHILGGACFPEHFFGSGGDVNRATAAEMAGPTLKAFSMEQELWAAVLEEIGALAVSRWLDPSGGSWIDPTDQETAPQADFAPLAAPRDEAGSMMQQVVGAMRLATEQGLVSETTAARIIRVAAGELGVDYDAERDLEAAREDRQRRDGDDHYREGPAGRRAA